MVEISNAAYGPAWSGDKTRAPSLDAAFDRIEQIAGGSLAPIFGTYQPVASTISSNLVNLTLNTAQYLKISDMVIVAGTFTTRVTSASVQSDFQVTQPFPSNFNVSNLGGGAGSFGSIPSSFYIDCLPTTKLVRFGTKPTAAVGSDTLCTYIYGYKIIP